MWTVLAVLAGLSLLLYFRGMNAVWGGLTLAVFGGLIWGIISTLMGNGSYPWRTVGKVAVIGVLLGVGAELLGKLGDRRK